MTVVGTATDPGTASFVVGVMRHSKQEMAPLASSLSLLRLVAGDHDEGAGYALDNCAVVGCVLDVVVVDGCAAECVVKVCC